MTDQVLRYSERSYLPAGIVLNSANLRAMRSNITSSGNLLKVIFR